MPFPVFSCISPMQISVAFSFHAFSHVSEMYFYSTVYMYFTFLVLFIFPFQCGFFSGTLLVLFGRESSQGSCS